GGRKWTTISTASLLIPALGLGFAVQNPNTSYTTMFILALLCGFGGANFSSSMSNISLFFPKSEKGQAMGINAGLGNLGVSAVQIAVPLAITSCLFGSMGGESQTISTPQGSAQVWLQNAGFIWVPFIVLSTLAAWFGMNDIGSMHSSLKEQFVIFKRLHNWILCWLYVGTFGSFIGFSAAFPLLISHSFPHLDAVKFAFLGPFVGAVLRVVGGWLSDKMSAAKLTEISYAMMIVGVIGVLVSQPIGGNEGSFVGFFCSFMLLFAFSGIGNGSTYAQVPRIFSQFHRHLHQGDVKTSEAHATKESATVLGFMGAIGAYGGFLIPKSFGSSIEATGSASVALWGFIVFYVSCLIVNYWFYVRKQSVTSC
ncbi:MFS transporter, partial [Snodgrassella alvi]|uniref:MFS transporter n=1 Tax=Snodgrassella alvi TaxID=1196083 RepID=UPI00211C900F